MVSLQTTMVNIEHPPEPVVKTSVSAALGGLCIIGGVLLLALVNWASRGEKDGKPDVFGKRVTIQEVAERYKAVWTPGHFWPRDAYTHTKKRNENYSLYKWVWIFLTAWLFCSGVFLVFAGVISTIEVFREDKHLRAGAYVGIALCLCSLWPIFFGWAPRPRERRKSWCSRPRKMLKPIPRTPPFALARAQKQRKLFCGCHLDCCSPLRAFR